MGRWGIALVAVLCGTLAVRLGATPVVQLDVWTHEPIAIHQISPDRAALKSLLARMDFQPSPVPGSAQAAVDRTEHVMSAISVKQISPNRIRISLATNEAQKGHRVLNAVRTGYASSGMTERLRMASSTSGGLVVGAAQAVGVIVAIAILWELMAGWARRWRKRRRPDALRTA